MKSYYYCTKIKCNIPTIHLWLVSSVDWFFTAKKEDGDDYKEDGSISRGGGGKAGKAPAHWYGYKQCDDNKQR